MLDHHLVLVPALLAGVLLVLPSPPFAAPSRRPGRRLDPRHRRMLVAGLGVGAAAVLLSLPLWGVGVFAVGAVAVVRLLPSRRPPLDVAGMRDLAGTLDLLATCLDAGLPVGRSITAVLHANDARPPDAVPSDGSVPASAEQPRAVLAEVAALLALGADPDSAWRPAAAHPELAPVASAARRSAVGGVRLADAVRECADQLRRRCRTAGERSAARAGVAMTAPLALCFLPAFVCLGLAPVIIGLVSTLQIW